MKCQVKDIELYYEQRGSGRPILMIHGYYLDHQVMVGAMEPIFASHPDWQRIYFDMPGMGQTPGPAWVNSSDEMLDVVDAFVEQVLGDRPFAVAGLSYGAYMARGLLRRRFEQINGLLLFAPVVAPTVADDHRPDHTILVQDEAVMAVMPEPFRPQLEGTMVVQDGRIFNRLPTEFAPGFFGADRPFLQNLRQRYAFTFDLNELPERFAKPTLIIAGRQDSGVGYWLPTQLVTQYPRATLAVLDRAGHALNLEQAGLFNQLVTDWIQRMQEMETGVPYDTMGERIVRASVDVESAVHYVWQAWTTKEGITSFFAPACNIDLRVGGAYEMYFDLEAPEGEQGSEGMQLLTIEPEQLLSFTWNAPSQFGKVREQRTAVTIRFYPLPGKRTRLVLTHTGWGEGAEWDEAFAYFGQVWQTVVLERLKKHLAGEAIFAVS
ncbi:MAG: alpha/beta fold hydrolase [Anaerolineales bacterium]|nr:alpha/beta fold hydrolase [Anaerolineales bacterium]